MVKNQLITNVNYNKVAKQSKSRENFMFDLSLTQFRNKKQEFHQKTKGPKEDLLAWTGNKKLKNNLIKYRRIIKIRQKQIRKLRSKKRVVFNKKKTIAQIYFRAGVWWPLFMTAETIRIQQKKKSLWTLWNRQIPISYQRKKAIQKQKQMRFLRSYVKSKLSYLFYEPWKNIKLIPTKKQQWLKINYNNYQFLRHKDRIDFFRTSIGQIILFTEINSHVKRIKSWLAPRTFHGITRNSYSPKKKEKLLYQYTTVLDPFYRIKFKLTTIHKNSWWYENLVQKKDKPASIHRFVLDRPNTAFQINWKQNKSEPWKNALLFKRALYAGFGENLRKENKFRLLKIKPYLRHRNPRQEKKNRLYQRSTKLLTNSWHRSRIRADKSARIKQLIKKIIQPFYGHLNKKQMTHIRQKSKVTKSSLLSANEVMLNHLENRLDVVVYRLNLAPSILWARRLIWSGAIFVTNPKKTIMWEFMYSAFKKVAFPLKLRDPKNLYSQKLWNKQTQHWTRLKSFGQSQTNIAYLVQPEDVIQCSSGISFNHFKTKSYLRQKPYPSHLLALKDSQFWWEWRFQQYEQKTFNSWEQDSEKVTVAIFLHAPRFLDLSSNDRVKESFFRWTVL